MKTDLLEALKGIKKAAREAGADRVRSKYAPKVAGPVPFNTDAKEVPKAKPESKPDPEACKYCGEMSCGCDSKPEVEGEESTPAKPSLKVEANEVDPAVLEEILKSLTEKA